MKQYEIHATFLAVDIGSDLALPREDWLLQTGKCEEVLASDLLVSSSRRDSTVTSSREPRLFALLPFDMVRNHDFLDCATCVGVCANVPVSIDGIRPILLAPVKLAYHLCFGIADQNLAVICAPFIGGLLKAFLIFTVKSARLIVGKATVIWWIAVNEIMWAW